MNLNWIKVSMVQFIKKRVSFWLESCAGIAAVEFALIFPILFALLLGVFDLGNGILANQKTIAASQIVADLTSRNITVSRTELDDIFKAGVLTMQPFSTDGLGIDIASIEFVEDDQPSLLWQESYNTVPNDNVLNIVGGLGVEGDGVLVVTVTYDYQATFAPTVISDITLREVAFARGRKSAIVSLE